MRTCRRVGPYFQLYTSKVSRPRARHLGTGILGIAVFLFTFACTVSAQTSVVTQHYDNARTGQNITETGLTPANVNATLFGKLFTLGVDGQVYAQPLYLPGVTIPGHGTHNVVYVATEHDSVYAFDGDIGGMPLWKVTLLTNGGTTVPSTQVVAADINPEIGVTGTPVIDPSTNTLYVVAKSLEGTTFVQRLHALDVTTGAEKFGGPIVIQASVPGTGSGSVTGMMPFIPQWENQRPGLLLMNGYVYIGFAAHGDNGPWHGWILSYNAATLQQAGAWCTSPNGIGSGLWGSGAGLSADTEGRIFVATGNGDYPVTGNIVPTPPPAPTASVDYGDSIVQLSITNGSITPTDYFTPYNTSALDNADTDLGSGGVLIPPDQTGTNPHILVQVGKQGRIYVVNRDKLTSDGSHFCKACTTDPEIIETVTGNGGLWSVPAYWNGSVYFGGSGDFLRSYSLSNGMLSASPTSESATPTDYPGSTPVISANGTTNGIVWTVDSSGFSTKIPSVLRAYDATNVTNLLYDSSLTSGRDTLGSAIKFVSPVVANGKVYVGTRTEVDVFGLLSDLPMAVAPAFSVPGGSYATSVQVVLSTPTPGATIYYTIDGTMPTTNSNIYKASITVNETETINALAEATGFFLSPVATATYTIDARAAGPDLSPAPGTYTTAQSVTISDTTKNSTIYYTTNGTTPTHNSQVYTAPVGVSTTTTINAIASAPGLGDSGLSTGTYTISTGATTSINFGAGFSNPVGMQFNGSTDLDDSRLQLTNGGSNEAGSAFFTTPMDIRNFTSDFTFQLSNAIADGITFTIQNSAAGATALGGVGGSLGYGGAGKILNSVAIKFDIYSNSGEGDDSTGLYTNGSNPTEPAIDISSSGIDLDQGDTIAAHFTYNGTTLTMTLSDAVINKTYTTSWVVNLPATVGANTAYVGFTGGSGGGTASQKIETWTFVSMPPQGTVAMPSINPPAGTYTAPVNVTITDPTAGAGIYYTLDGSTPTPGTGTTKQYAAAFTLPASATVKAIATATGFIQSAVSSASYTISIPAPTPLPTFTPAPGIYSVPQSVQLVDSGATIYYTTNGTMPTHGSAVYTAPIAISATTTISAIASAPGLVDSAVSTGTYTLSTGGATTINFGSGFAGAARMQLNGSTGLDGSRLQLTNGAINEAGSAFFTTPIDIRNFVTDFTFQLSSARADGITFTIQNSSTGAAALGGVGASLGYGGTGKILNSVAIKFDIFSNSGEGSDSTGLYTNGATPTAPATDISSSGIMLAQGDPIAAHITYDGTTLTMTLTDAVINKTYTTNWTVNLPSIVGGNTAYLGFTGASGGLGADQEIETWTLASTPPQPPSTVNFAGGFTSTAGLQLNGSAVWNQNASRLTLTNGGKNQAASAFYTNPVNVQTFTNDFSFQLTNATADGFTFAIQNAGPTAVGAVGGSLGYDASLGLSVAVKFDLYSNSGEGSDSTGEYSGGAKPIKPALDMTASGVNLHSGDLMNVHMTYDGTTLAMTVTDPTAGKSFSATWPLNIPTLVGGPTAFVGFTAGTGGSSATQEIVTWNYAAGTILAKTPIQFETEHLIGSSLSSGPPYVALAMDRIHEWQWNGIEQHSGGE